MRKTISILLALMILAVALPSLASTPATLNQKMATRSGPGTKYSEELGTLPQSTSIVVINMVTTNGTPWCLVEFRNNGKLYRCYTGLKRINLGGSVPEGSLDYVKDTVVTATKAYYGPGTNYAERKGSISKGEEMRVFEVEGDWALVEYKHGGTWQRGYIPVDALKKTESKPTPVPTATPAPTPVPTPRVANNILDRDNHICIDYYGNEYNYGSRSDDFVVMVGALPVMSYFDGVPCVKHSDVYSGPGNRYWRRWNSNGSGYAYTGILDTNLRIYGQENGWIMIRYPSDANGGYRYGWTQPTAISAANQARTPAVEFAYLPAVTTRYVDATDDPDRSIQYGGTSVSEHITVTALAFLNADRNWVYCEYNLREGGSTYIARGFLPADGLRLQ
ncbi:MAG: hypothetical protein IJ769_04490 [Clostridia bacterium]|nr:hypothetical protein [Clostridia bacterium]